MARLHDELTRQFHTWELGGRGLKVFEFPVSPEPPFRIFRGYCLPDQSNADDGRRPTAFSEFLDQFKKHQPRVIRQVEEEPEAEALERNPLVELQTSLPSNLNIPRESFEQFLTHLDSCTEPITFEIVGSPERITAQFTSHPSDARLIRKQLQAYFPDAVFVSQEGALQTAWSECSDAATAIFEFGLSREFMLPLASGKLDPFIGLCAALSEIQDGELGIYQVLFQPVCHRWSESIVRSVTDTEGKPFFVNWPELVGHAQKKISRPLYAAVVRIATRADHFDRAWEIAAEMASSFRVFAHPQGNELIPLTNDEYPVDAHEEDVLRRQTRRSGMILNADELLGFVHLPSVSVRSPKLLRQIGKTKSAPNSVLGFTGLSLGLNEHAGRSAEVRLNPEQRVRHVHVIGASGTGKSTLLFNLIQQDIANGEGVAVLDPHGDLVDRVLGVIPSERVNDVVLLDPTDEEYSIGFNILSAHSDFEKTLLASDLVSVFRRLSSSWGDQLNSVLNNAILAFLESSQGGTLADLRRFLLDAEFRNRFLETVRDPDIVYYWRKGFPQLGGNKSIGPVLTRLETFLSPKPIRYMVSQQVNRLDFADILDNGRIFLAKLPQGQIGKENSFLLGSLLVSKFQQLAMSRQRMSQAERRDFWLYIDEFHYFITPSMAEILTGARKYRLGLVLAHHELHQLQRDPEVASAVMSHPYTRIVFRVGDTDAHVLERGFASFEARDLQNLEIGHAVCRVERSDFDFNLSVSLPEDLDPLLASKTRDRVTTASREKYALPRVEVEAALLRAAELKSDKPHEPRTKRAEIPKQPEAKAGPMAPPAVVAVPTVPIVPVAPEPPKPETVAQTSPPVISAEPGRGGAQHKTIQHRIKAVAEALGYRAIEEKSVLDGTGSVDLALEKAKRTIACEITITTTIDHEFGNVTKCLKAGFGHVAVISIRPERLAQIKEAVNGALGSEETKRVGYYSVDEFLTYLNGLAAEDAKEPPPPRPEAVNRGYKVKRSAVKLSPAEAKAREDAAIKMVAEAMNKK